MVKGIKMHQTRTAPLLFSDLGHSDIQFTPTSQLYKTFLPNADRKLFESLQKVRSPHDINSEFCPTALISCPNFPWISLKVRADFGWFSNKISFGPTKRQPLHRTFGQKSNQIGIRNRKPSKFRFKFELNADSFFRWVCLDLCVKLLISCSLIHTHKHICFIYTQSHGYRGYRPQVSWDEIRFRSLCVRASLWPAGVNDFSQKQLSI